ncbi:MAG: ArsS family sensor histidine kinase [Campylobacteraceae bacterium]|jgi:two-component system OmpR family sensor kinase|nr:ArsS family sensor histidine kinase [Campylobacteraceae bacterium]
MKNYSLGTKVSITFAFCLLFLLILFVLFYRYESELNLQKLKERHLRCINYVLLLYQNNTPQEDIENYFKSFEFKKVANETLGSSILQYGNIIVKQDTDFGNFSAIIYDNKHYISREDGKSVVIFESQEKFLANNLFFIILILTFSLLVWLYISIIKSIEPIREFGKVVRKLAGGDTSVQFVYDGNDEIGELSQEFNKATRTIANLHNSRTLFLRTIMHELKTPIGKGRIIAEMVEEEISRNRLIKVFKRLEVLINEFTRMEQVITKNYILEKNTHSLKDIFNQAVIILMFEPEQVAKRIQFDLGNKPFFINADLGLMVLAFKNLMDNAIKYGKDNVVKVVLKRNILSFYNKGEPLEKPIEEYRQAFASSTKRDKIGGGLGLGLYIVDNILKLHDLKLDYEYKNGQHCFFIALAKA